MLTTRNFAIAGEPVSGERVRAPKEYRSGTTDSTAGRERGKLVHKLIPLNLDGYMFSDDWDLGVLANEIRSRVAADFRDSEKPNSNFAQQVDRVIKALRADEGAREKPPPSRL